MQNEFTDPESQEHFQTIQPNRQRSLHQSMKRWRKMFIDHNSSYKTKTQQAENDIYYELAQHHRSLLSTLGDPGQPFWEGSSFFLQLS